MNNEECVLVVDDDEITRFIVSEQLNKFGINTIHAASSNAALIQLTENNVKVVITDMRIDQEFSGIKILILSKFFRKDIPVFVMSGGIHNEKQLSSLGAEAFIPKPFQDDSFCQIVDAFAVTRRTTG